MEKKPIVSMFFILIICFSLLIWFFSKSLMLGIFPIIVYVFVRLGVNLMLIFDEAGKRV